MTLHDRMETTFVFALVKWNKPAVNSPMHTKLWMEGEFEVGGPETFLPVQRVHSRFVAGLRSTNRSASFVVCPITRRSCF